MPESIDHRELAARANDRLAVYNPTDTDYRVAWDSYLHSVPAKSKDLGYGPGIQVLPRYIAEKYVSEMADRIITQNVDAAVASENKKRVDKQQQKAMDHWEERPAFESSRRLEETNHRPALLSTLYKGVVERYAEGEIDPNTQRDLTDQLVSDQSVLQSLERPYELPQNEAVKEVSA